MAEDWQEGGFGLYVHWPFCQAKCPYCDFNSHVVASIDQGAWQRAYLAEIDRVGRETSGRTVHSVFFGGGTPSLMSPDVVSAVLDRIRSTWPAANDLEVTLEANPTSVESGRFLGYREAGVTRLSMGIQALNDPDLKRLGRLHTTAEAQAAFDIARDIFQRVSFDLIYARQDQTLDEWEDELSAALSMAVDHFSLYQLTIEPGTSFGDRHQRGRLAGLPSDDLSADMYLKTQDICSAFGLPAYETSNHARDGAESRHNLIYWRYGDYAGIGPGAHGRLTLQGQRHATETETFPSSWLKRVERLGSGETLREAIPESEQAMEFAMMNLRLTEGMDMDRYCRLAGKPLNKDVVARLEELGMVEMDGARLKVTQSGRPVLNEVLRQLLAVS